MKYSVWLLISVVYLISAGCLFADEDIRRLAIKDHRFIPSEINIPSWKKIKLVIENQDAVSEEFESYELNREKVILGGQRGIVFIGPLKPGRYKFFGEFNQKTAQGVIEAEQEKVC